MLKYLTAGESHGKCFNGIVSGLMSGITLDLALINDDLRLRQMGVGRNCRNEIEFDKVEFLAGIKNGVTTGAPISFVIRNNDDWYSTDENREITAVRSGHADFVGCKKFGVFDARPYLERSSGRNTAPLVVIGSICRQILKLANISITSSILSVGGLQNECSQGLSKNIVKLIESNKEKGDTLGGVVKISIKGCKAGVGEYGNFNGLDAELTKSLMAIGGVKGIEVGNAFENATKLGSEVKDLLELENDEIIYQTNFCGGIVGGLATGGEIVLKLAVKPIPTLKMPTKTFDIRTKKEVTTFYERADTCAIESVAIVAKSMTAITLLTQMLDNSVSTKEEFEKIWKQ